MDQPTTKNRLSRSGQSASLKIAWSSFRAPLTANLDFSIFRGTYSTSTKNNLLVENFLRPKEPTNLVVILG